MNAESDRAAALRGIGWMVLAAIGYSVNAGLVKQLSGALNPMETVFWRTVVGVAFLLPWMMARKGGGAGFPMQRLPLFLLRGVLTYLAMLTTYYALAHIAIADVQALQFTMPLFSILAVVMVLHERAGTGTWIACFVGFAGTLVILRPGFAVISLAALAAIASAGFYSVSNLVIKMLARTEDTTTITLYGNVIMLPLALLPLLFDWRWPGLASVPWIIALGVFTTLGQWALARAISSADARVVWPFDFLRLPFTVVIGYVMFSQLPGPWTWVGAVLIFGSAYYVIRREATAK
ncbi:MAG: DMT family transporter [Proteobacteria bacterium]|nr:DMT family transporter [Pseudomonadota bacterium]